MNQKPRITKKSDIKVFILYLFKVLKELKYTVDYQSLTDIIVWEGTVNYFDFGDCFAALLNNGTIEERFGDDKKARYSMTEKGWMIVENLEVTLLDTVKENAMRSVMRYIAFREHGTDLSSRIEQEDGGFRLYCSVKNQERELVGVNVYSPDPDYLKKLQANFNKRAEAITKGIIAFIAGEADYLF